MATVAASLLLPDSRQLLQSFYLSSQTTVLFSFSTKNIVIAAVVAAREGMETLRPALQRVYMSRASVHRDALKSFIQGYQEGIQQLVEGKVDEKIKEKVNDSKKSTPC